MAKLSSVNTLLRLEGLVWFVGAIVAYVGLGGNGWLFVVLLFSPDLSMVGYARDVRVGSWLYNAAHHVLLPALVIGLGLALELPLLSQLGLIWLAHIGMDRAVGYGLKYPTAFNDTHLQRV